MFLVFLLLYYICLTAGEGIDHINFNTHAINSIYTVINLFITRIPIRVLHFYQTIIYAIIYVIFSVIYDVTGGTDPEGERYIYKLLDWTSDLEKAALYSGMIGLVGMPVMWIIVHVIYKLRLFLYGCCEGPLNKVAPQNYSIQNVTIQEEENYHGFSNEL